MATKSKRSYSRKFLNKNTGMASIETSFEMNSEGFFVGGWDASVAISDCNKVVSLDFSVYDDKDIDKVIHKITVMLEELEKFGNLLLEHREQASENIKKAEAARKKRIKERTTKPFEKLLEELNDGDQ